VEAHFSTPLESKKKKKYFWSSQILIYVTTECNRTILLPRRQRVMG